MDDLEAQAVLDLEVWNRESEYVLLQNPVGGSKNFGGCSESDGGLEEPLV